MRITKKVFTDLGIYMILFGVIIGVLFPVFTRIIGIPTQYIDAPFIIACLLAGLAVGVFNITIAKIIVGRRVTKLSSHMKYVNENLKNIGSININECYEKCVLEVDSEDEIGESSKSFNSLVKSFLNTLSSETSIRNFTEIFTNELDVEKLSEKAMFHLLNHTNSSAGAVLIDRGGEIIVSTSYVIKDVESLVNHEIVHRCFSKKERILFELTEDIIIESGLLNFHPKSVILEPVVYKGDVLGVILMASLRPYTQSMLDDLDVYTHGLSLGMHNAITHDKLEQLAILDPLTKVYNRRFGIERFKEEFGRSIRSKTPLGVLMLDIDHFKNVNDTYGHIVGDQVLIAIAEIINGNIRKEDVLIRYGGEEFMAILPGASKEGTAKVAEKIRRFVEEHRISNQKQEIKVTISIGGTSYPEFEPEEIEDLIKAADEALYSSKDSGRNKVTVR